MTFQPALLLPCCLALMASCQKTQTDKPTSHDEVETVSAPPALPANPHPLPSEAAEWMAPVALGNGHATLEALCSEVGIDCYEHEDDSESDKTLAPWGPVKVVETDVGQCVIALQAKGLWFNLRSVDCISASQYSESASVSVQFVDFNAKGHKELRIELSEFSSFEGNGSGNSEADLRTIEDLTESTTRVAVCSLDGAEPACTPFFLTAYEKQGSSYHFDHEVESLNDEGEVLQTADLPQVKWKVDLAMAGGILRVSKETGALPADKYTLDKSVKPGKYKLAFQ